MADLRGEPQPNERSTYGGFESVNYPRRRHTYLHRGASHRLAPMAGLSATIKVGFPDLVTAWLGREYSN